MAQPGKAPPHGFEDIDRAIAVLNIGSVHENEDEETAGVSQDVALAALDLLARVIAAGTAALASLAFGSVVSLTGCRSHRRSGRLHALQSHAGS